MNLEKAIRKQEKEINDLQNDVNYLLKLNDQQAAIKKQQRIELLEKQIQLARLW